MKNMNQVILRNTKANYIFQRVTNCCIKFRKGFDKI